MHESDGLRVFIPRRASVGRTRSSTTASTKARMRTRKRRTRKSRDSRLRKI